MSTTDGTADLSDVAGGYMVGTQPSERFPIWTRANVGEVFPDPVAPGTFDFAFQNADSIRMSEQGFRDAYVRLGAFTEDELDPDNCVFLGVFGGYAYLNASIMRIFGERAPGLSAQAIDDAFFGAQPGIPPYQPHPDDIDPEAEAKIGATFRWALTTDSLPDVLADEARVNQMRVDRPDFSALGDHELVQWIEDHFNAGFREFFAQHIFITFIATVPLGILTAVCEAVGRPADAMKLIAGVGDVESAAPATAMWDLGRIAASSEELMAAFDAGLDGLVDRLSALDGDAAEKFAAAFDDFLFSYGSRGPNEWEMSCPTWETNPILALAAIDRMRLSPATADPRLRQVDLGADRERLSGEIAEMVAGDPETHGQFMAGLSAAKVFMAGRERTKTNCVKFIQEGRIANREFGRRMVQRGVFPSNSSAGMLTFAELHSAIDDATGVRDTILERQTMFETAGELQAPFVIVGDPPPAVEWPRRDAVVTVPLEVGESIQGMPGCPGISQGRARVVLDSHDPTALEPGDVLVARLTDPSWTPLFVPASGVIVDVGAALSHAIIVSRELGIPCVVSATDATRRIPDGALVEVNGDAGTITVLEL
ncbi:MAG: phosphohistidine swiveling domain-containing protein [Candidatus Poriferisodalaceae bacterium]|jgi:phosphohistidine swiveling domain-containing protein